MPLYKIINPSDPYTMRAPRGPAIAACLLLGRGYYTLRDVETGEDVCPLFLPGDGEEMLSIFLTRELGTGELGEWIEEHREQVTGALCSVMIGDPEDRRRVERVLGAITNESDRELAAAAWHDERRSSLNDIGGRCAQLARGLGDGS